MTVNAGIEPRSAVIPALPTLSGKPVIRRRHQRIWLHFRHNRLAVAGGILLLLISALAIFAPTLAPYDPAYIDLGKASSAPSWQHWLGTDRMGRDILSRILFGGRVSLGVGFAAMILGTTIGVVFGAAAGYARGAIDGILMRFTDMMLALPTFFLLITVQAIFVPSVLNVILVIGLTSWMGVARIVRGQFLTLKHRDFVIAARATGCSKRRIVFSHILPNVTSQILVSFTLGVANAVLVESALSFLGLGVPVYQASWGNMLMDGQMSILTGAWWVAFFPGLMILLTAEAINLFGDGLEDALYR